jgi:hypothetical protein
MTCSSDQSPFPKFRSQPKGVDCANAKPALAVMADDPRHAGDRGGLAPPSMAAVSAMTTADAMTAANVDSGPADITLSRN